MRHVARKGLFTIAAAGGMLAAAGGVAQADSGAQGSAQGSPGIGSGNTVQAPVDVPVNVCGNTVNAAALLNPAFGNSCANDGGAKAGGDGSGGSRTGGGGAQAQGQSSQSPGVLSGNTVQAPVHVPVNACGNSASVVGVGNAAYGNECVNGSGSTPPRTPPQDPPAPDDPDRPNPPDRPDEPNEPDEPRTPERPDDPADPNRPDEPTDRTQTPPKHETHAAAPSVDERLADTGTDAPLGALIPISGGLLLAGAVLYRRARASAA